MSKLSPFWSFKFILLLSIAPLVVAGQTTSEIRPEISDQTTLKSKIISGATPDKKKLLKGKYLNLVGGYKIPNFAFEKMNTIWSSLSIDKLPGSTNWILSHPDGYVVELLEPGALGTGDSESWPEMIIGRNASAFKDIKKIAPGGVFWLTKDLVLTSGRKTYRTQFEPTWIETVDATP